MKIQIRNLTLGVILASFLLGIISCNNNHVSEKTISNSNSFDKILAQLESPRNSSVLVVAHRADWHNFPENSIPAIQSCIKMGVDMVEIDVAMTKDSVFILMHDNTLNRTTTGTGLVSDYTFEQIQSLKLRDGARQATEWKVPSLEEVLNLCRGQILINLDKSDKYIGIMYPMLKNTGCLDQIIIGSYLPYDEMRKVTGMYLDSIYFMPKVNEKSVNISAFLEDYLDKVTAPVVQMNFSCDTSFLMAYKDELKAGAKRVWTNAITAEKCAFHGDNRSTYDIEGGYGWLIDNGFNVIQTDRPQLLLDYLRKKGLHD